MIGLSGLIDNLLAAKISPRLDVLAIKGETEVGAPGPVLQVQKVENDVRLLSNAALDRLIPVGPSDAPPAAGVRQPSEADLSVAARVISAVLSDLHGDAGPVRGASPAWPSSRPAPAATLAGALAQTVSDSGLFYESHLAEFATGTRTLAQLAHEPQARWATPLAQQAMAVAAASAEVSQPNATKDASPAMAAPAAAAVAADGQQDAAPPMANTPAGTRGAQSGPNTNDPASSPGAAPAGTEADLPPDAARVQAAYRWGEAPTPAAAHPSAQRAEETIAVRHAAAAVASGAATPAQPAEVVHPQAIALVHQQLDLLATAVFRWSGEAWPGVAMNWTIEKEAADSLDEGSVEDSPRRWSTTVSMSLPRLGEVVMRLSLAGSGLQARLAAGEPGTVAALRADGDALVKRLEAAGFRMQDLQVAPKAPAEHTS
ncbi:flagellar hook-length control protein FliK [Variovorax sp. J2P1-59]|uniref:flagellar hook-length control protein FliK n=1 Tax=Variovorax flavidus TaxID=3053501 RepID=UPI0025787B9F|nr:flagellar hook-length control protein FliK [Variovorax sp. J2P1-59]MDM0074578.1 flagellar hook-length control protein FliK [Variovorax sp. J2P1-59]